MPICQGCQQIIECKDECILTENAERHTFKAPCCCYENEPYTELTTVCTINVSIDCKKNEVSNHLLEKNRLDCNTRQSVALFVFCFQNNLCAKMMFSMLLQLQIMK